jgi:hypothetical protein
MRWIETDKGDSRCRELADRHYTRGKPGHPMWCRPGWNQVLYAEQRSGRSASFCWWRPKWESGIVGTERKDGLRCIECSIFHNETRFRASDLIIDAIACLLTWEHANDVEWPDGIITGINTLKTAHGRADDHEAGYCFRKAGFELFAHPGKGKRADVWLRYAGPGFGAFGPARAIVPPQSQRLIERRAV